MEQKIGRVAEVPEVGQAFEVGRVRLYRKRVVVRPDQHPHAGRLQAETQSACAAE
jgi:hypothetical protein